MAVSLVDVSVSTETQLNVRSITRRKMTSRSSASIAASVKHSVMSVAMSGSIMPTPLATPTMRAAPTTRGGLRDGVGRHDPAGDSQRRGLGTAGTRRADATRVHRILPADDAGGCDEHVVAAGSTERATDATTSAALARPSARGHVGVLGDDHDGASGAVGNVLPLTTTLGPAKLLLVNTPAARAGTVRGNDHEVVGVVLDADVRDVARETPREGRRSRVTGIALFRLVERARTLANG